MAFDEKLAAKVRTIFQAETGYEEKKMFGGICFLMGGNMACGILNDELIVRVGPDNYEDALQQDHTREFDITGRTMKGWVMVEYKAINTGKDLKKWVDKGRIFAKSLPPKNK